jgi:hypothetical protein
VGSDRALYAGTQKLGAVLRGEQDERFSIQIAALHSEFARQFTARCNDRP